MPERGVIRNRDLASKIRDFSGLRFGKITPTDIDGFLDFGDKLFIFIESKHENGNLPYGQKLALERLCDACHNPPKRVSILLIGKHSGEGDIDFGNMRIEKYRWKHQWITACPGKTVGDIISFMVDKYT